MEQERFKDLEFLFFRILKTPAPAWAFTFFIANKNQHSCRHKERHIEYHKGIEPGVRLKSSAPKEVHYDAHIQREHCPPLPPRGNPTPTKTLALKPVSLRIVFEVINVSFYHTLI